MPPAADGQCAELLGEIDRRLHMLESRRPVRIEADKISITAKLPYKALMYREALIWRVTELGRCSYEHFKSGKLGSAILLARASIETSAALWYLRKKLFDAARSHSVEGLDESLMKLVMGSKTNPKLPPSINVLTFLDHVEKKIPGFRDHYERLSEFAHPSWAATTLLYSKNNAKSRRTEFGLGVRNSGSARDIGILSLDVALQMFEIFYEQIDELMPHFITLCESCLESD